MRRRHMILIIVISLAIHIAWVALIVIHNPAYMSDYRCQRSPDAWHYFTLAQNMVEHHVFSRSLQTPYLIDPIRTPGYPAIIALFYAMGVNPVLMIILLQIIFYVASTLLLYEAATVIVNEKIGFIAAILMSFDMTCHSLCYELLTETAYMFFLVLALYVSVLCFAASSYRRSILLGIVLSAIVYVRPSGWYLSLFVVPAALCAVGSRTRKSVLCAFATFLTVLGLCWPWIGRNIHVFDIPKMSIIDDINLAYSTGGSVYSMKYDLSLGQAQDLISERFALPTYTRIMNFGIHARDYRSSAARLHNAGISIITSDPAAFLRSSLESCVKSMMSHSVDYAAHRLGKTFSPFGIGRIASMDVTAIIGSLRSNSLFLNILFFYEAMFNGFVVITLFAGLPISWLFFRRGMLRDKAGFTLLTVMLIYLFLVTSSMGAVTYYRFRAPNMPFVYFFSATTIGMIFCRERDGYSC